jgi:putative aldouronate transport system substrate-binding protein
VNGTSKLVINSKADAEKIDRILQIFDWWVTDEGTSIMKNGIEGIHYKKNADGKYEVTDKWESDFPRFLNSSLFTRPGTDFIIFAWSNEEDLQRHNAYTELAKKYPWTNDAGGLEFYSKTYTDKAANLNTKFEEAVLQIIVGKQPVEYIEQASKDWLANGGEQIIKEINEAVKK